LAYRDEEDNMSSCSRALIDVNFFSLHHILLRVNLLVSYHSLIYKAYYNNSDAGVS